MGEPTTVVAPALAPVASLGVVLAGCPDCRLPVGLAGAPGLAAALAAHRSACPLRPPAPARPEDDVCPGCGCEAELVLRASGRRCSDCLAEALLDDLAIPAAAARRRAHQPEPTPAASTPVISPTARRYRQRRRRQAAERVAVA